MDVFVGSVGAVQYMTHKENKALKSLFISLGIHIILLVILISSDLEFGTDIATSFSIVVWNILMTKDVKALTCFRAWFSIWRWYAK